jgi:hypothetical protein
MDGQNRVKTFQTWALCYPVLSCARTRVPMPRPRVVAGDSTRRCAGDPRPLRCASLSEHEPHPFNPPLLPSPTRVELVEQSSSTVSIPAVPRHPSPISTRPKPLRLAPNLLRPSTSLAEPLPRPNRPAPPRPPLPLRPRFAPPSISYLRSPFSSSDHSK